MRDMLRIAIPLTIWLAAFSAIYGLGGLVCSERWAEAELGRGAGRLALLAAWAAALAVQAGVLLALRSPRFASPSAFVQGTAATLAAAALFATAWTLLPAAATSLCL